MAEHCRHARYVWNLAVEQQLHWQPGRRAPDYNEQCAQLTAARAEYDWLAAGSQIVQTAGVAGLRPGDAQLFPRNAPPPEVA
jgi:hypothetical protein